MFIFKYMLNYYFFNEVLLLEHYICMDPTYLVSYTYSDKLLVIFLKSILTFLTDEEDSRDITYHP